MTVEVRYFQLKLNLEHLVEKCLNNLKCQVRDGTSLLYDIEPLFVTINLGQSGFADESYLNEYMLIKRVGAFISNREFLVSVLRHLNNPL